MSEEHRRRTIQFNLKLFQEEMDILENQSEKFNMSKSEFLRNCILYGGVYRPERLDKEEIKKLLFELNRIGNNVNQIAYNTNSNKGTEKKDILELKEQLNRMMELYKNFAYEK